VSSDAVWLSLVTVAELKVVVDEGAVAGQTQMSSTDRGSADYSTVVSRDSRCG